MSSKIVNQPLAIQGGPKVRTQPLARRILFGAREKKAVVDLLDRAMTEGHTVLGYNGPQEDAYCKEFAAFMGGGFADGVNSGTNAVYVALRALEPEPFSEVIVPAISDPGGIMPVAVCNCIPVPADCAPGSFNIGADQIAARITKRTSAIIVAHIAGIPADMDPIMKLARSKGIPVIEDCAQSHGAMYKGRKAGSFGDVAAFSLMFGKHHATGGQGGIVYTRDEKLYWQIRRYADRGKTFGIPDAQGGNVVAALNCNMDEIHAAIGRVQLKRLPAMVAARRKTAAVVREGCRTHLKAVRMIQDTPGGESAHWFLLMHLDTSLLSVTKEQFVAALNAEGIGATASNRHIPTQMNWCVNQRVFGRRSRMPWAAGNREFAKLRRFSLPNAEAVAAEHFTIAIHECTTRQEAKDMVTALRKVEKAYLKR